MKLFLPSLLTILIGLPAFATHSPLTGIWAISGPYGQPGYLSHASDIIQYGQTKTDIVALRIAENGEATWESVDRTGRVYFGKFANDGTMDLLNPLTGLIVKGTYVALPNHPAGMRVQYRYWAWGPPGEDNVMVKISEAELQKAKERVRVLHRRDNKKVDYLAHHTWELIRIENVDGNGNFSVTRASSVDAETQEDGYVMVMPKKLECAGDGHCVVNNKHPVRLNFVTDNLVIERPDPESHFHFHGQRMMFNYKPNGFQLSYLVKLEGQGTSTHVTESVYVYRRTTGSSAAGL